MSIPDPVMSEKSKKSVIKEQANKSMIDQTSQLSFSSVNEVKNESNVKIEVDETYDCGDKTMFVAEEKCFINFEVPNVEKVKNEPLNTKLNNVDEMKNEPVIKIEAPDDCFYESTTIIKEKNYQLNTELTNVKEMCNQPNVKVEIDIVNNCRFETVVEIERNRLLDDIPANYDTYTETQNVNTATRKIDQQKFDKNIHSGHEINNEAKEVDVNDQLLGEKTNEHSNTFICHKCKKLFITKQQIIRHMIKIHNTSTINPLLRKNQRTNEYPYTCDICFISFSEKSHLIRHSHIHSGEKLYTCLVCLKLFTRKTSLLAHGRVHTGEKPYTCGVCSKTFLMKSQLTRHSRIHSRG